MSRESMIALTVLGIVGGTDHLGPALSRRRGSGEYSVVLGPRDPARAGVRVQVFADGTGPATRGMSNLNAATAANIVSVPFALHTET